jgi:putative nucleotidyltransferase with HDIG domain
MVDADTLTQVPLNRQGASSPPFGTIANALLRIKKANPPIKYIYTMARTQQPGRLVFVVDPQPREKLNPGLTSYPGDFYDATGLPAMLKAFDEPSADVKLGRDSWGVFLSGYAPIRDKSGKTVAILGVDMTADAVLKTQTAMRNREWLFFIIIIAASLFLGVIFSRWITAPVRTILLGTQLISAGDLTHKVEVKGPGELAVLARSFNDMSSSLAEARQRLHEYFYNVLQSFVRIIEAKDPYTRGHSERVAEYAAIIAAVMGMPGDRIQTLKEAAILHDIGKLAIDSSILNKEGKLTDEEWQQIRRHPAIGEEILRPILLREGILAVVRYHHERLDGNGYPDGLSGGRIDMLAAIVSVADAYDAMTSRRAYRVPLTSKAAMEELMKNRGTQFMPEVVDAFITALKQYKGC